MNTFQSRSNALSTVPVGHNFGRAVQRERDQAGGSTWLEFVTSELEAADEELVELAVDNNLALEEAYDAGDAGDDEIGHGLAIPRSRSRSMNSSPQVFASVFPTRPRNSPRQPLPILTAPRASICLPPHPDDRSPQGSPSSSFSGGSPVISGNPAIPGSPRSVGQRLLDALSLAGLRGRTAKERAKRRREESWEWVEARKRPNNVSNGKLPRAWRSTSAI